MIFWTFRYVSSDLWYDEVYTLEHFTLVDFSTTVFYYPAPNNHIFYNLINQLLSRLFGLRDILTAESHSFIFRNFQFLISLVTAYFLVHIVKKYVSIKNSLLVLVILFTTIPFMNFSLQLRGYGLSTLLVIMLVYFSLYFFEKPKNITLVILGMLSCLLMYTIPSNLYVFLGVFTAVGMFYVFSLWNKNKQNRNSSLKVLIALSLGLGIASILYLPIWEDLIHNKFSDRNATSTFQSFGIFLTSIPQFFSKRYFLLLVILPGIYLLFKRRSLREKVLYLGLLVIFIVPFVVSFIHQKSPYSRVFVSLAPVFVLLISIPGIIFLDVLSQKTRNLFQWLIPFYCIGIFIYEVHQNDLVISKNLCENNSISQDLYENYFLAEFFQQDKTMKKLSSLHKDAPIVMYHQRDEPTTELYLKKYHLTAQKIELIDDLKTILNQYNEVFLITSHKIMVLSELDGVEGIDVATMTPGCSFTSILKIKRS